MCIVFKKCYLLLLALHFFASTIFAEGSRELNASMSNDAYRVFLSYTEPAGAAAPGVVGWYRITDLDYIEGKNSFYVYAKEGEKICLASSALGLGGLSSPFVRRGSIKLYSPLGVLLMDTTKPDVATGAGLITAGVGSKQRENDGPFGLHNGGGGKGYKPIIFTVPLGGEGIYRVEIISPRSDQNSSEYTNPASGLAGLVPKAKDDFNQYSNNACISAFDISVMNVQFNVGTGLMDSTLKLGRVYADYMSLTGGRLNRVVAGNNYYFTQEYTLKILTFEGYRYDVSVNGMAPYGYFIYADNVGMQLVDGITPAYESIAYQGAGVTPLTNRRVMKPGDPETNFEHKHKMYFNEPDNTMPNTATSNGNTVWLYKDWVTTNYNYTLTYILNQTPNPMAGWFRFNFPIEGVRYRVIVDVSNDNIFGNLNDTTITSITTNGINYLWWSGLDGNGAAVPNTVCIATKIELLQGEMHVPLADVEMFRGGIQIKRINGGGTLPDYNIHWNDLPLNDNTELGSPTPPYMKKTPNYGVSSASFAHRWEKQQNNVVNYSNNPTHTIDYGDNRYMDNWAFDTSNSKIYDGFICYNLLNIDFVDFSLNKNQLQWEVNNNAVNGTFTVEHSFDGKAYYSIGSVLSIANKITYAFTKNNNLEQGYFRIKLHTGVKTIYSKVIRLKNTITRMNLYPNPANDYIVINYDDKAIQKLTIFTIDGKVVMEKTVHNNEVIKVKHLLKGAYVAQLTNTNKEAQFIKFQISK